MTKATIVKWLKNESEQVKKGEPIVQIETEKVTHKIEAPEEGVLLRITVQRKTLVPIGTIIGYVGQPGENIPESVPKAVLAGSPKIELEQRPATVTRDVTATSLVRVQARVSPRAKRLAAEKGIDLEKVTGTGPDGMIMEENILDYIEHSLNKTKQGLKVKESIPRLPDAKSDR